MPPPFRSYTPRECVYDLTYTTKIFSTGQPLPDFIKFDGVNGFELSSSDPNDFGIYNVQLSATVNGPNKVGTITQMYYFTVGRC